MSELTDKVWVEKYRPADFSTLIFDNKSLILNHLKNPLTIPSFIFYSNHPGTGKTTTAKLIIKHLGCDALFINSSDERGIETIREKITHFARGMSSTGTKRCIFMDESDSLTKVAMDSLRATMEEFSDNCFFIFACNDLSKIIEPIQSRCVLIAFGKPNKADIIERVSEICESEGLKATDREIIDLVEQYYPDIRSMVKTLQNAHVEGKSITINQSDYNEFLKALKTKNIEYLYNKTYSPEFDVFAFNRWLFRHFFDNISVYDRAKLADIAIRLAEIEKGWNIGANIEIIFLANMLQISKILGDK
jgi:DNA polymerase III delta prime subunit